MDNGDGKWLDTGKGSANGGIQSVVIDGLNPSTVYKFRLSSRNICDNVVESAVVSSSVVQQGMLVLDEINSISWKPYTESGTLIEYQLKRDDIVVYTTNELSYLDKDVKCGKVYKYELVAIVQNDVRSYSAPVSIEPKTAAPEVITQASVTVTANNIIETKVVPTGPGLTSSFDLVIERNVSGKSEWEKISGDNNPNLAYSDKSVDPATNSYCYRFRYTNACKLSAPDFSEPVCSILLEVKGLDLKWTKGSPFSEGIASYGLVQTDAAGTLINEINRGLETSHTTDVNNKAKNFYQIRANAGTGGLISLSILSNCPGRHFTDSGCIYSQW